MITYCDKTPLWIRDWVTWSATMLAPEWDMVVTMSDDFDKEVPDSKGSIEPSTEYLRADVYYKTDLQDNRDGHERVVHEIIHAFTARMSDAAQTLISSKIVRKTCWKNFEYAEEETVVRLSRVLVTLRKQNMVDYAQEKGELNE